MNSAEILEKLNSRYACKSFDANKKISDQDFATLEESLRLAPSSFGLQPWKFIVVKDASLKEKLRAISWNQIQVTSCSHLVCICTKTDMTEKEISSYISFMAQTRGISEDSLKDYKGMMTGFITNPEMKSVIPSWTAKQGYIALGFLMETAALLGIDTCPMEGFDAAGYNELLGLNGTGFTTTVICPVGYRSAEDGYQNAKKVRFPKEQVFEYR
jgi:nitroreductase